MQFEFTPRGRVVSDEDYLADLQRVARLVHPRPLSISIFRKYGKYSPNLHSRFGGWVKTLQKVGLPVQRHYRVTREQLIQDIAATAKALNVTSLNHNQYVTKGKFNFYWVDMHFENWAAAAAAAGVDSRVTVKAKTILHLFDNLEHVWFAIGKQPRLIDIDSPPSQIGRAPYIRCFGNWQTALRQFTRTRTQSRIPCDPQPPLIFIHKTPRQPSTSLRFRVMARDHFRCCLCGRSPAKDPAVELHIDHVTPWCRGGETVFDNLRTLCQPCNNGRTSTKE